MQYHSNGGNLLYLIFRLNVSHVSIAREQVITRADWAQTAVPTAPAWGVYLIESVKHICIFCIYEKDLMSREIYDNCKHNSDANHSTSYTTTRMGGRNEASDTWFVTYSKDLMPSCHHPRRKRDHEFLYTIYIVKQSWGLIILKQLWLN